MRVRTLGIFALGFACGMLFLALGLWILGGLPVTPVSAGGKAAVSAPPPAPAPSPAATPPAAPPEPEPAPAPTASAPGDVAPPALHLAMPIAGIDPATLTDTFNEIHSGHKHEALDIPAPRGTPVLAVAEGNVVKLFKSKPGGLTVYQFDDSQTYCFYYAHLLRYAPGLTEHTLLRKGDVLGYVDSTGNASPEAPHLHFEVSKLGPDKKWWQGTPIDPLPLLK